MESKKKEMVLMQGRNKNVDIENRLVVAKGEGLGELGEGCVGNLGLVDANYYM